MKDFKFQQFSIRQTAEVFRVGTDAVLLGALCDAENAKKILEVGTGSGIVSLMLAQRNPEATIEAIDITLQAVQLATLNFSNSKFSDRLTAALQDYKNFDTTEKFDLIVCNPPYFAVNSSEKDKVARQKSTLDFQELISISAQCLQQDGFFCVIIPSEDANYFVDTCKNYNLNLIRKINVFGIKNGKLKRNILEFSTTKKPYCMMDMIIEDAPRKYSKAYLDLTKNFHVFE